jgi:3-phosphoshikimate 1-carboxyvinyltransferase
MLVTSFTALRSYKTKSPLSGHIRVPGDKSISHRALMFGGLARGETIISGLLMGEDVLSTATAMRSMGAHILFSDDGLVRVKGVGLGNLIEPTEILDMGNSGTSTRLLMGIVAGQSISATFTGDHSLIKRPMARVITPLEQMGASFLGRSGGKLPLTMRGQSSLTPMIYEVPVASAQVKSAILLAGLTANGTTTVIEPEATRNYTETMLKYFGANIKSSGKEIQITGGHELIGCAVDVPSDPSSAAFPIVAACIVNGSQISIPRVGINKTRGGLFTALKMMGADIRFEHQTAEMGEDIATISVYPFDGLNGVHVPIELVPSMIDEFPILAIAAACANGTTTMTGLAELRVKESDRLQMMADGLSACGVKLESGHDWLTIHGTGKPPKGGAKISTAFDHRIAMSFLVLGSVTDEPIEIDDGSPIKTSFPNFLEVMEELGMDIRVGTDE